MSRAAAFLTAFHREHLAHRALLKRQNKHVLPGKGRASCVRSSITGALHHQHLGGGPPSNLCKSRRCEPFLWLYAACCVLPQWQPRRCSSLRSQRDHTRTRARDVQERAAQMPAAVK